MTKLTPPEAFEPRRAISLARDRQRADLASLGGPNSQSDETGALSGFFPALLYFVGALLKFRVLVVSIIGGCLLAALAFTLVSPPVYRAEATMQIERTVNRVVQFDTMQPQAPLDPEFYRTQYELLKSRALAEQVAGQLEANGVDIGQIQARGGLGQIVSLILSALPGSQEPEASAEVRRQALVTTLESGLSIRPVTGSQLVELSFSAADRTRAAEIVNTFADAFIKFNLQRRVDASSYARNFLEEQLELARVKLEESEKAAVEFAQQNRIVDVVNITSTLEQELKELSTLLNEAVAARIKAEQIRQAGSGDASALPASMQNETIQKLRQELAKLNIEYADKLRTFDPSYPDMQDLSAQIESLREAIREETNRVRGSLDQDYEAKLGQEKAIQERIQDVNQQLFDLRDKSITYTILRRESDTNKGLYDGLLQRFKEIGAANDVNVSNVSIVDRAVPPKTAAAPSLTLNLLLGLLAGIALSSVIVFGLEQLDDTFGSADEVERELNLTMLGILPSFPAGQSLRQVLADPRAAFSEAIRSMRTAAQFALDQGLPKSISVTSARPGDGKSTVSLSLARSFAEIGTRVILIDGDMRKPTVHNSLALSNKKGLSSLLDGTSTLETTIQASPFENLYVITSGPMPENPAQLISGENTLALAERLEAEFDMVIFDSPPVIGLSDAPLLGSIVECYIIVASARKTPKSAIRGAIKRMAQANAKPMGAVLNRVDFHSSGYGYGYGYGTSGKDGSDPFAYGISPPAKALADKARAVKA